MDLLKEKFASSLHSTSIHCQSKILHCKSCGMEVLGIIEANSVRLVEHVHCEHSFICYGLVVEKCLLEPNVGYMRRQFVLVSLIFATHNPFLSHCFRCYTLFLFGHDLREAQQQTHHTHTANRSMWPGKHSYKLAVAKPEFVYD